MSDITTEHDRVIAEITQLERERAVIYEDDQVTAEEHPRLAVIKHEIERLWDLRRRIEAAIAAGFDKVPVMPTVDPSNMQG